MLIPQSNRKLSIRTFLSAIKSSIQRRFVSGDVNKTVVVAGKKTVQHFSAINAGFPPQAPVNTQQMAVNAGTSNPTTQATHCSPLADQKTVTVPPMSETEWSNQENQRIDSIKDMVNNQTLYFYGMSRDSYGVTITPHFGVAYLLHPNTIFSSLLLHI